MRNSPLAITCRKCGEVYTADHCGCPQCAISDYRAEIARLKTALRAVKEWYDGNWVRSKKALRPVVEIVDAALNPK